MSSHVRNPYEDRESSPARWAIIFVLISLLVHLIIIVVILLITHYMPPPKIELPPPEKPAVHLTLVPPPQPEKVPFIPTPEQPNVPHKPEKVQSAHDTQLTSMSKVERDPNSIMPDIQAKREHPELNTAPSVKGPEKPEVSSTPPTPKTETQKPTPPKPPTPAQQPAQPTPPTPKPTPPKPTPPTPPKPEPQVDDNGLPVLPPINAKTMAQVNPQLATPPPAQMTPQEAGSVHGKLGSAGANSPAAMATALGRYKQKFYRAVGSRWYPKVDSSFQLLGVGQVRVQYTIHSDGSIETKVLDPGGAPMQTLLSISVNSIREASPFDPFPPELIKELISQNGGDGSSFTDDFTFSVY